MRPPSDVDKCLNCFHIDRLTLVLIPVGSATSALGSDVARLLDVDDVCLTEAAGLAAAAAGAADDDDDDGSTLADEAGLAVATGAEGVTVVTVGLANTAAGLTTSLGALATDAPSLAPPRPPSILEGDSACAAAWGLRVEREMGFRTGEVTAAA
jgi:hypothetical protein